MCECVNWELGIGIELTLLFLSFKKTQTQPKHKHIMNSVLFDIVNICLIIFVV
jgi:hypothetical protein